MKSINAVNKISLKIAQTFLVRLAIFGAMISGVSAFAHNHFTEEDGRLCNRLKNTSTTFDFVKVGDLRFCAAYAYVNVGDFYETALHFARRAFNHDPYHVDTVTNIMLWEWSRSNDYFNTLPGNEGKDGLKKALAAANRASKYRGNRDNPRFNFEVGKMSLTIGRFYNTSARRHEIRPEFLNLAAERFLALENDQRLHANTKVVARMSLGHIARYKLNYDESRGWYEKAIEIAPNNAYTTRAQTNLTILAKLTGQ